MSKIINNLSAILAIDSHGGIGKNNTLAWKIPEDLKWFKSHTINKSIIMGSKTLQSILEYNNNKLLPKRHHIILSRNTHNVGEYMDFYRDTESFLNCVKNNPNQEYMLIGGAQIYEQLLPYVNTLYLTKVKGNFNCDKFLQLDAYNFKNSILTYKSEKKDATCCHEYEFTIHCRPN